MKAKHRHTLLVIRERRLNRLIIGQAAIQCVKGMVTVLWLADLVLADRSHRGGVEEGGAQEPDDGGKELN